MMKFVLLAVFLAITSAKVLFSEDFSDADWEKRWVVSTSRPAEERGKIDLSAGKFFTDETVERGLRTSEDARFYALTTEIPEEFNNKENDLVFQYSLKQDQSIDCGGGYLKLHPAGIDQEKYNGDSEYNIMFGPDICGSTRRTHVILNKRGDNHLIKEDVPTETDTVTHVYTLILKKDNTFKVLIDNNEKKSGSIEDNFAILEPKQIPDPNESKPSDWVDEAQIVDPEDKKPEGYDDIPPEIEDPEAEKPDDWDDELDGEWEAPVIPNPEYKGPWKPRMIPNPEYKGEWVHPLIDNPAYEPDNTLYAFDSFKYVGIEIWQVKSGSVYDNILITDDAAEAKAAAEEVLKRVAGEREGEKKAREEEEAARAAEEAETELEEEEEKEEL